MTEVLDISYLASGQQSVPFNNIEFEFDDIQSDSQIQNHVESLDNDQSLLNVLDDSREDQEEDISQAQVIPEDTGGILEERLSDYENEEHYEEERLSDYEHNINESLAESRETVECEPQEASRPPRVLNYEAINATTEKFNENPKVLHYALHTKSELPIIREPPIVITSRLLSKDMRKEKLPETRKIVNKTINSELQRQITSNTKTFRIVTSSKTLTNTANNLQKKTVVRQEICRKPESYDSDSEVLLGFDSQLNSSKICYKIDPNSNSKSEYHNNSNQEKSISDLEFDKFENSFNTNSYSSTMENLKSTFKIQNRSASNFSISSENPAKFMNRITKIGDRTIITKVQSSFTKQEKPNEKFTANRNKRTSDEMNVAMAMQKLQDTESNENSFNKKQRTKTQDSDEEIHLALAKFFMECDIPLCVVEDPNFREFVKLLRPSYIAKLPDSKRLLQTIVKLE